MTRFLCVVAVVFHVAATLAMVKAQDEEIRSDFELPVMRTQFDDTFEADLRSEYGLSDSTGFLRWEKSRLILEPKAGAKKAISESWWLDMEIELYPPKLTKETDRSELRIWLDLATETDCYIAIKQTRINHKTRSSISVVDTRGEWNEESEQVSVREPLILERALPDGLWRLEYRSGLWTIYLPGVEAPMFRYIQKGSAGVQGVVLESESASHDFARLACKSVPHPEFNAVERAALADALQLQESISQLYQAGEYVDAIPLAESAYGKRLSALGRFHPDTGEILNNRALLHLKTDEYEKSNKLFAETKEIFAATVGTNHPDYSQCLNNLAALAEAEADYSNAESYQLEALAIRTKVLGDRSPDYVISLLNLAGLYATMEELDKAEQIYEKAKISCERVFGKDHFVHAAVLNGLASICKAKGSYEKAESLYLDSKVFVERTKGKTHPAYATVLNNLGHLYDKMGLYEKSIPLYEESQSIRKELSGERTAAYATGINNLAQLHKNMGDYAEAERLYLQAMTLRGEVLGTEHPNFAQTIDNLAHLYRELGEYEKAEPFNLQAKSIREKTLGKNHPGYAESLGRLGLLYFDMGFAQKAEQFWLEELQVLEALPVGRPSSYASNLNNLGMLYKFKGDYERAAGYFIRAKDLYEKIGGPNQRSYATAMNNLAELYRVMERFDEAETLALEAISIRENVASGATPDYGTSLNSLTQLYSTMGEYTKAEQFALRTKDHVAHTLGKSHPWYATSLENLGAIYQATGEFGKAEATFAECLKVTRENFDRYAAIQSVKQQMLYSKQFGYLLSEFIFNALQLNRSGELVWRELVDWKGINLMRKRQMLQLAAELESKELFQELRSVKTQLAHLLMFADASDTWKRRMRILTEREEELEKKIGELTYGSSLGRASRKDMSFDLPRGVCLIDFRLFDYRLPSSDDAGEMDSETHYLAFVVAGTRHVKMIDLGAADRIDALIAQWRRPIELANENSRPIDTIGQKVVQQAGAELRKVLWNPIAEHLATSDLILLSPDGALGRFPFNALPGSRPGTYLIEEARIATLPVPAMLPEMLNQPARILSKDSTIMLVGDVNYGSLPKRDTPDLLRFQNRRLLGGLSFGKLPETRVELSRINEMFNDALELTQDQATEAEFEINLPGRQILHIATHGFFRSPEKFRSTLPVPNKAQFVEAEQRLEFALQNPNLLSGLAFAGANRAREIPVEKSGNDGVLYSDEIALLPMNGVELSVLSACETNLGTDNNPGEGLIGIQRAFQVAGVKTTVASYWRVNDRATQMLMTRFYKNLLEYGAKTNSTGVSANPAFTRIDALRDAQLWMLRELKGKQVAHLMRGLEDDANKNEIARAIKKDKTESGDFTTHPRYWAAFVLSGDWR